MPKRARKKAKRIYYIMLREINHHQIFQDEEDIQKVLDALKCCIKYIHQNPVKAGLAKNCTGYKYSSYGRYVDIQGIVDCDFISNIISMMELLRHNNTSDDRDHFDIEESVNIRLTDEQAQK